jgi:hypothetical protein
MIDFKRNRMADKAFAHWQRRLGYEPEPSEKISQLPDNVVFCLAELGHEATLALYDLVMGVRDLGPAEKFHYLKSTEKVRALDAFLFVLDQVRFDLMQRLGWVHSLAADVYPLVDLASRDQEIKKEFSPPVPLLVKSFQREKGLWERPGVEHDPLVRSLIPEALEVFRQRL